MLNGALASVGCAVAVATWCSRWRGWLHVGPLCLTVGLIAGPSDVIYPSLMTWLRGLAAMRPVPLVHAPVVSPAPSSGAAV